LVGGMLGAAAPHEVSHPDFFIYNLVLPSSAIIGNCKFLKLDNLKLTFID